MLRPDQIEVQAIDKRFGDTQALKNVSFTCRPGEVHCLLGENGAGKSTLMRILAGAMQPDSGRILVAGQEAAITSPRHAQNFGIAMVYQDTRLVPDLDVVQNIWLGREPGGALVDRRRMVDETRAILARLDAGSIALDAPVGDLAVGERQIVEIARALTLQPQVLILDEPTSAIDRAEIERLFSIVRGLKASGTTVIFISHRLPEVFAISDRVTVLKDGAVVGTVEASAVTDEDLVQMMVGREIALAYPERARSLGARRLDVCDLSSPGRVRNVSFSVAAGEIVGLGGIQGNGQSDVVRAVFGLLPFTGEVRLDGKSLRLGSPAKAIAEGIVYVPGDRHREGLFQPHSIRENVSLPHLAGLSRGGLVSFGGEARTVREAMEQFGVKAASAEAPMTTLSGGNQQKVVLGRWTRGDPQVFIFEDPTRGVDVATKLQIYREIRALAERGAAVVLVASDLMELIGLSDRILIFSQGRIVDEVRAEEATEERIVGSATGAGGEFGEHVGGGLAARGASQGAGPLLRRYADSLLLVCLILALAVATSMSSPYFLSSANASNLAMQVTPLAIVALGQLAVILLGGVDLSVGPLISLVTAIVSYLAVGDGGAGSVLLAIVAGLGAGLATGIVNGAFVLWLRIPDLIATLASFSIVFGVALLLRPSPGGLVANAYLDTFEARIAGIPALTILALVLAIAFEILLVRGRLGQRLYGTGSSEEAARITGIRTGLVRGSAYAFCGTMAALAGLMIAARIGTGDAQAGAAFTLNSITAVVVGGASIFGGRGSAIGALLGAVLVGLMQNALNLMQVSAYYQYVWAGALTLLAVSLHALRARSRN